MSVHGVRAVGLLKRFKDSLDVQEHEDRYDLIDRIKIRSARVIQDHPFIMNDPEEGRTSRPQNLRSLGTRETYINRRFGTRRAELFIASDGNLYYSFHSSIRAYDTFRQGRFALQGRSSQELESILMRIEKVAV